MLQDFVDLVCACGKIDFSSSRVIEDAAFGISLHWSDCSGFARMIIEVFNI